MENEAVEVQVDSSFDRDTNSYCFQLEFDTGNSSSSMRFSLPKEAVRALRDELNSHLFFISEDSFLGRDFSTNKIVSTLEDMRIL